MLPLVFPIYKPIGATPLQALELLRTRYPELSHDTMAYAGRLDPMAEGVLLVLRGDACRDRDEYQKLSKTYEIEVLLGVSTDTYDILGLITKFVPERTKNISHTDITPLLDEKIGIFTQIYPPYSAARVNGKPLFYWARQGVSVPPPQKRLKYIHLLSLLFPTSLLRIFWNLLSIEYNLYTETLGKMKLWMLGGSI